MEAAAPMIPVNPSNPATIAMIRNMTAHLNMKKIYDMDVPVQLGFCLIDLW